MVSFGAGFFAVPDVTGFCAGAALTTGTVRGAFVACAVVAAGVDAGEAVLAPAGNSTDPAAVVAVVPVLAGAALELAGEDCGAAAAGDDGAAVDAADVACAHGLSPCAAGLAATVFLCPKMPLRLATAVVAVATADAAWSLAF